MTKANIVRSLITKSIEAGYNTVTEELIKQVQSELGFTRQLSRAYLNNNFPKVLGAWQALQTVLDEPVVVEVPAAEPELVPVLTAEEKAAQKRERDAARKREQRARAKAQKEAVEA
jgi:hypothetical protein